MGVQSPLLSGMGLQGAGAFQQATPALSRSLGWSAAVAAKALTYQKKLQPEGAVGASGGTGTPTKRGRRLQLCAVLAPRPRAPPPVSSSVKWG